MTTTAIAFSEIERQRPDLIEKLGLLFLRHPDPAPFWVAAGGDREIPRAILGVKREYLEAAFDEMETKYGTIERDVLSRGAGRIT